jgi:hypothetical protein
VQAAGSNEHELESFVLVEAGPHARRPCEMESENFVVALVESSKAGCGPNHDGEPKSA